MAVKADPRKCEHCGARPPRAAVLVTMKGPTGEEWYLCVVCWADGLKKDTDDEARTSRE